MFTLTHLVGILIASATGALVGAAIARLWPLARLGKFGAPFLGALISAPCAYLLQLFGAGSVGFQNGLGVIDWIPVLSVMLTGGLCATAIVGAVGLIRFGGRRERRR